MASRPLALALAFFLRLVSHSCRGRTPLSDERSRLARGLAPTHSTLVHLPQTGLMEDPGAQQVQKMAILYVILNSPLDRPGAIYQYAADEEITAVLTVSEDKLFITCDGSPLPKQT
jgi:hypothetical protein